MAQLFADAARAYLSAGINNTATTISIASGGTLFPVANGTDWFKAVLQDASGIEIVYVTAHTSGANTFTVTRGQEGTTARSFAAGAVFGIRVTAADMVGFAGKLADAPSDGKTYGRKNAAWAEVVGGASYRIGDVQIAPTAPATGTWLACDGSVYLQSSYAALFSQLGVISNAPGSISQPIQRTAPSAINWASVAYGNGIFVAIANGSTTTATSTDGITWTARSGAMPSASAWSSLAFGNGVFVAVTSGNTANAATSTDGVTWTARTLPVAGYWNVAFGAGTFVAISTINSAGGATSPDGITWTQRTIPASSWESIAYGNGTFVAVAYNTNVAATSPDGINWTQRTLPANEVWTSIAFGNGTFVAVGGASSGATSPDGVTWTARVLPSGGTAVYRTCSFGNGTFIAAAGAGSSTVAATSSDGITWRQQTLPSASWRTSCFGNGLFVLFSTGSAVAASAYASVSYDGSTQFAVPRAISSDVKSWVKAA